MCVYLVSVWIYYHGKIDNTALLKHGSINTFINNIWQTLYWHLT